MLASRGLPLGPKSRYSAFVCGIMLYGSQTWPVKEEDVRLERNDARMVRWMCNIRPEDRVFGEELKARQKLKSMGDFYRIEDCNGFDIKQE